jgi:hypothetical protein
MSLKTMKYNHLLIPAVFLTVSILGCHSNNTPTMAPLIGTSKEGTVKYMVPLPNFVRPHEAKPLPSPSPFITVCLSPNSGSTVQLKYTITDDLKKTHGPYPLPSPYTNWTFNSTTCKPTPYHSEAQVPGSTNGQTLYTNTVNPNNTPGYYNVHWSTTTP